MAKAKSLVIKSGSGTFVTDVQELRRRARAHMEQGAVTEGYRADVETVLRILNEALATEIVCVLRYKRHYYMAAGIHASGVADEFLEHANSEQRHADQIAERIAQLGGEPDSEPGQPRQPKPFGVRRGQGAHRDDPGGPGRRAHRHRVVSEMVRYLGNDDPTTRRMLEEILAEEEEHADDLRTLLESLGKDELEKADHKH